MNLKLLKCLLAGLSLVGSASSGVALSIEKGKSIQITATEIPDAEKNRISGVYPVSDDGFVTMPLVGKVAAAGLSDQELEAALTKVFQEKKIYQNARFQVISVPGCGLRDQDAVIVGGRVRKPGPVRRVKNLTIFGAIQAAGGVEPFGSVKWVKLTRNGEIRTYELGDDEVRKIPLQKNDVIDVPGKFPISGSR